jgi:sec-independent protein translocase protein TatA
MAQTLFLGNLGTSEIIIIALVVLLLFGGKKIPELMHGIGKGVRSFKTGMNEIENEINAEVEKKDTVKKEEK